MTKLQIIILSLIGIVNLGQLWLVLSAEWAGNYDKAIYELIWLCILMWILDDVYKTFKER